ncbi:hypothetical protein BGZ65_006637, partial [Modicella reniformis]
MAESKHPPAAIETANFLSYFSFSWIQPLLIKGWNQTIVETDLDQLSQNDHIKRITDKLLQEWSKEVEKVQAKAKASGSKPKRPNLVLVLWRCFGFYYSISLISGILESACKIGEAILMGYVIRFINMPAIPTSQGMVYAIGLFLVTLFHGTMHHHYFFPTMRTGMWIRQSLTSLMYRKCLTLSTSSSIATGTVVNLISNDVQPFENGTPFMLYTIIGPVEMIVVMYFLWNEIQVACLSGLLGILLLMPIQSYFSRHFATIRAKTVNARDDRIRTLSDVFQGIELVKLCAWEIPFREKILMLRSIEVGYIWKANLMRASNMSIYFFFQPLIALFVFVTFWLQGKTLSPDKVFVSLTLFNVMRLTMTAFFPKALETMAETRVSIRRITDFMLLPELHGIEDEFQKKQQDPPPDLNGTSASEKTLDLSLLLEMRDASFSWTFPTTEKNEILELSAKEKASKHLRQRKKGEKGHDSPDDLTVISPKKAILNSISMTLRRDELLAIVGPVGCGKSSFCMALLQEMPLVSGSFVLAKQERGRVKMSYSAQSPWIFAGTIRSNILFGSPFNQEWYDRVIKACELTRDLSLFSQGDETIIGEKGVTLSGGQRARVSLARAAYRDSDIYILDDPLSAVDPRVGRALFDNCINGLLKGKARVLVTHQLQYIKDCHNVIVLERGQITHMGHVDEVMKEEVEIKELVQEGGFENAKSRTQFVNVLREFAKKASKTPDEDEASSNVVENLVKDKILDTIENSKDETARKIEKEDDGASVMEKNLTTEEVAEGETSLKAYLEFFRIGSTWAKLILTVICFAAAQGIMVGGDFFLSIWSAQGATEQTHSYYPTVFGLYCLGTVIMTLIRSYLFTDSLTSSARNMFRVMLDALMRTNVDFFHANPHGRILNRFSKDMANCDELLPYVFFDTTQIGFMLFGSIVTVCVVNPWIIIAIPFILSGFVGLRTLYIQSSRQVKRIDSQTRSPIYSHLSETLDGLTSVRAFGVSDQFVSEHIKTQEDNGRAFFTYLAMSRWLGYRLDAVSALFLGVTAIACVA